MLTIRTKTYFVFIMFALIGSSAALAAFGNPVDLLHAARLCIAGLLIGAVVVVQHAEPIFAALIGEWTFGPIDIAVLLVGFGFVVVMTIIDGRRK